MADEVSVNESPQEAPAGSEAPVAAPESAEQQPGETKAAFEDRMDAILKESPRVIKVNGKERKVSSWSELERYTAREMSAEERFSEAKRLREETEGIKQALDKGDILDILRKKGLSQAEMKKAIGEVVNKLIEDEEMDPRDRKLKEYELQEEARKRAEQEATEAKAKEAHAAEVKKKTQEYVENITDAAQRLGLKADPFLLGQVASELQTAYSEGVDMRIDDAVRLVRDRFVNDYSEYVRGMDFTTLKSVLGDEMIKRIQREGLAEAKGGVVKPGDTPNKDSSQADDEDPLLADAFHARKKPQQKQSQGDFFKQLQLGNF